MKPQSLTKDRGERLSPQIYESYTEVQCNVSRYVFASKFALERRVLDIACGTGFGSSFLRENGARLVVGGDISESAIKYATEHYDKDGLQYTCLDACRLPFSNSSFDVVISLETIEHLPAVDDFLKEIRRILKSQGLFICSTPNKEGVFFRFKKPLNPYHLRTYSISEFRAQLAAYFDVREIWGMLPLSRDRQRLNRLGGAFEDEVFSYKIFKPLRILCRATSQTIGKVLSSREAEVKLSDVEGHFETFLEERFTPYRIDGYLPLPASLVSAYIFAVCRKP